MSGTPPYVELHAHSAYSFLDGASHPQELIERAAELGHIALGLTDHDSVGGAMELAMSALDTPVRAIFGAEVTVQHPAGVDGREHRHLTLLVRDSVGWSNLCRLLTHAHAGTRDTTDRRAGQPSVPLELVLERSEGLVCLTGCAEHGIEDQTTARGLLDAFSPERLRVELQRPYARGDKIRNRARERLARRLGVATVATGDVHAHTRERAQLQHAFVAIHHGLTLDGSEVQRRPNDTHVLARPQAMAERLRDYPDAVAETVRLAETLTFNLTGDLGYRYPGSDSTQATRELAEVCHAQFAGRYPRGSANHSAAAGRLEQELQVIDKLGLSGFFLLHHEILELAREVAVEIRGVGGLDSPRALLPPGRGRGSSVSSIVCYLTGLSHIDPIQNDLAIGRFLHEDITGLPDIDIDFPRDIRAALIVRVPQVHGYDRAALVATSPTFRARGAIRELGKALGLPAGELDRVARGSEGWGGHGTVAQDIKTALGPERCKHPRWAWLARLADQAYGLPRNLGQHPGGMVIATRPLIDCVPIVPAAMADRQIVQWDKDSCSDAGFLKIDLLGLGMLSAVERCVETIAATRNERIDLSRIPFDDKRTFEMIQRADTTGVFQIESRAQMGSLQRTKPANLDDLTVQVALVRPGPIVGGAVNTYIERRQALLLDPHFKVPFLHPSLEEPLKETLGTIVFQDQVIEVARTFAGFTAGEAESLRRAMSRKRSQEAMDNHHQQFLDGARANNPDVSEAVIEQVWNMVAGFAGFGFPKAHGAAFGLLAYQSTWLRVYYFQEFLCALLNEQPMGFYPPDSLIHEAQRRGATILPPDVNHSHAECTVTQTRDTHSYAEHTTTKARDTHNNTEHTTTGAGEIRVGLRYIKGVQAEDIDRLIASRTAGGPFRSLADFAARAGASTPTLERLAWSGACDALAGDGPHARRTALWQLGLATPARRTKGGDQLALNLSLSHAPRLPALSEWEEMIADYSATGISIEHHPIQLLRDQLTGQGAASIAQLATIRHGTQVKVGGFVIARQKPGTANGITFLLLEDEGGTLNVIVPEKLYEAHRLIVRTEPLILVEGTLERHADGGGAINLLAKKIARLARLDDPAAAIVKDLRKPEAPAIEGSDDFAVAAPAVMNFGRGRGR
jgi:error-prone DNA polymerase